MGEREGKRVGDVQKDPHFFPVPSFDLWSKERPLLSSQILALVSQCSVLLYSRTINRNCKCKDFYLTI